MNLNSVLNALCTSVCIGHINETKNEIRNVLKQYAEVQNLSANSVMVKFAGKDSSKTLMLDAHIDQVGFIVTEVTDDGFLRVASVGSVDTRILYTLHVSILAENGKISGVFCSTPPHLSAKGEGDAAPDLSDMWIDTLLGDKAKEVIKIGDYVVYADAPATLLNGRFCSSALDNRAGCAVLLKTAELLKDAELPYDTVLLFSDSEELGLRGAKTAAFTINPDEAVAVDVTFATAPDVSAKDGGKLGGGAMVGYSPVLSREISDTLCQIANEKNIEIQREIMSGITSTNADVIGISRGGVKCSLLSIPLRNMHTSGEVAEISDIESAAEILAAYVERGGCL